MTTNQQHQTQVSALAHRLIDIVCEQGTHLAALQALISAYASVAINHPCCARAAADTARRTADLIERHAVPAASQPIH